ncbi:MAG TPA: lysylphosphatidylglycerol synthase domain-containing protein [Gemmatimonadaceae bacterium]|nr:lysylphosphatidylglycerol synthase domain-containing protein [Gemmatimonadaceae bacterium]
MPSIPTATRTTEPPPEEERVSGGRPAWNRWLLRAGQALLAVAVVYFAATKLAGEWSEVRVAAASLSPRWELVAASCFVVLVIYAVLVAVWCVALTGWNARLPYWPAARVWMISNLGKYVPGKVWTIGTMIMMTQKYGISPLAAGGSSVLTTATATVTGFAVVALTGAHVLPIPFDWLLAIWIVGAGLLAVPVVLPRLGTIASRLTGRSIVLPPLHAWVMIRLIAGTALSWCLYGVAFQLLALGLLGHAAGSPLLYIAIFAGSYLIGFLAVFAPGGLVVREGVMVTALATAGFSPGAAVVLAVASRLWLTVLEILPALVFLAIRPGHRPGSVNPEHGAS